MTNRGGRKRQFKTRKEYQRYLHGKAHQGYGNDHLGNMRPWKSMSIGSMQRDMAGGYGIVLEK